MLTRSIKCRSSCSLEVSAERSKSRLSPMRSCNSVSEKKDIKKHIQAHLSGLELDCEFVVHQSLQSSVVFFRVLLLPLGVDLLHRLLVCKLTLNGNMTGIENQMSTCARRDTNGMLATILKVALKTYFSGMMMTGAARSICTSIVLCVCSAYSKPALV